jgi:hypothetical protein
MKHKVKTMQNKKGKTKENNEVQTKNPQGSALLKTTKWKN